MGQRLTISLIKDDEEIAALYYHWSGYTYSALEEIRDVVYMLGDYSNKNNHDLIRDIIHVAERNGGGIKNGKGNAEWNYIKEIYSYDNFKSEGISRNDGLVAISKDGISDLRGWADAEVVYMNLDTEEVSFGVLSSYDSLEDYIEDRSFWDDDFEEPDPNEVATIDCDITGFYFDDVDFILSEFDRFSNKYLVQFNDCFAELYA